MTVDLALISVPSVVATVALYFATLVVYRLFFDPLAKFPGPKLAAISRWYEAYYDVVQDGQYIWKIAALHKQYGPIIRISPYELHVNDPEFFTTLYRQDGLWDKYAWSYDAFALPLSTFTTADHHMHKRRRAALNSFFSKQAILKQQQLVQRNVTKLRRYIMNYVQSQTPMHIGAALSAMAVDISTELTAGESYNNLDHPDFNESMNDMVRGSMGLWRLTKHVRFVNPIMMKLPIPLVKVIGGSAKESFFSYLENSSKRARKLMADHQARTTASDAPSATVVDAILDSNLPHHEKRFKRISEDLDVITGAGFETTAAVLRCIVFHVYRDPQLLFRLRGELSQARQEALQYGEHELTWPQLEKVTLLTAVIMEGLRLSPGVATRLARIAPDRDLLYANTWKIPAGTPVGMTTLLIHLNEELYPEPHSFNPDRWKDLHLRKGDISKMFAPFSRGTRMCLGMYLAWAELYLAVAMLVMNFDFDLLDTTVDEVAAHSDVFTIGTKSSKGVWGLPSVFEPGRLQVKVG